MFLPEIQMEILKQTRKNQRYNFPCSVDDLVGFPSVNAVRRLMAGRETADGLESGRKDAVRISY
jgi:hypothetical protein